MGRKAIDLTGQRFGRLVAVKRVGSMYGGQAAWLCKCDCGEETVVGCTVLRRGGTKSCGCLQKELTSKRLKLNGSPRTTHGGTRSRIYYVWRDMLNRCEYEKTHAYKWYGAKGVKVCEEWHDFAVFRDWANSNGYDPDAPHGKCTLDRIDPFGDYEPNNCRWVTMAEQAKNKRHNSPNARLETQNDEVTSDAR